MPPNDLFSKRELEVIFWVQQRLTSKEIAIRLDISRQTVEGHLKSIYRKAVFTVSFSLLNTVNILVLIVIYLLILFAKVCRL